MVEAVPDGRQPEEMRLQRFMERVAVEWDEQRLFKIVIGTYTSRRNE